LVYFLSSLSNGVYSMCIMVYVSSSPAAVIAYACAVIN